VDVWIHGRRRHERGLDTTVLRLLLVSVSVRPTVASHGIATHIP